MHEVVIRIRETTVEVVRDGHAYSPMRRVGAEPIGAIGLIVEKGSGTFSGIRVGKIPTEDK